GNRDVIRDRIHVYLPRIGTRKYKCDDRANLLFGPLGHELELFRRGLTFITSNLHVIIKTARHTDDHPPALGGTTAWLSSDCTFRRGHRSGLCGGGRGAGFSISFECQRLIDRHLRLRESLPALPRFGDRCGGRRYERRRWADLDVSSAANRGVNRFLCLRRD